MAQKSQCSRVRQADYNAFKKTKKQLVDEGASIEDALNYIRESINDL